MIQLQFINRILDSGDSSVLTINNLDSSFFSDYPNEYAYIKEHIDKYSTVPDKATFLSKFPQFDIIQVNESNDYLISALYEDRNKRELARVFNQVRNLLNDGKVDEAMTVYTNAASSMVQDKHIDSIDILRDTSRYNAYVERCEDFKKYYVLTGFKELDEIIGGWDRQEELVTIAARTNMGKSWVLLKCALAAVQQGLRVGLYSGEMSERKVGYRVDTLISHISNSGIVKGNADLQTQYKRYIDTLPNRYQGCLKVLTPQMIDGPAGVSALRAFIEKENLDMLCIDQHSLLEDDRHGRSPVEKASNISRDLKNLQVLKKIPIIAVSQQNRESTDNGVNTQHIAQSDRIAQDSTIIIFFEQKDGIMTMHLVKSRDSANMKNISYACDLDKGLWQYIPEGGNALDGAGADELKKEFYENEEEVF